MLDTLTDVAQNLAIHTLGVDCDTSRLDCVKNFPGLDIVRVFVATAGFVMTIFMARISIFRKQRPMADDFEHNTFYALLCMGLLFSTQEVLQVGANFVVWRLPLIVLTLWFGWKAVLNRL